MIRTSKAPVAWPVPWLKGQVFFFRAGGIDERAEFEAVMAGECRAGNVYPFQLSAAFAEGVRALLHDDPEGAARLIGIDLAAATLERGKKLPADEAAAHAEVRELLTEHWPAYRVLVAREARRNELAPVVAFRRFCEGWKGDGLPEFKKDVFGEVDPEVMRELSGLAIKGGGAFAYSLLYATGEEVEKNSERPLSSGKGRTTSSSPRRKAGGKSTAKSGRRTPSSSSRAGRSRS